MMKKINLIICLICIAFAAQMKAEIKMPSVFSDGMVLQANGNVRIWGNSTKENAKVTVKTTWDSQTYETQSVDDGTWALYVKTADYGGPYDIEISDGKPYKIGNVLLGEVWLCSGQSNMDMRMSGRYNDPVEGALDAIITSENPDIRMFNVGANLSSEPQRDCGGEWKEASTAHTPDFSATAYFFARKLNEVLHVPVGIIMAAYGGSRVEAWTSEEGIKPFKGNLHIHNECILYNGMISPVLGYTVAGFLWYQGEANVDEPDIYRELFPAMVKDWRNKWNDNSLPFYYAQIAPNNYNKGEGKGENSAYLREAQMMCREIIPDSDMIILMDVGSPSTIHPKDKKEVGDRFAYMALAETYGKGGFTSTGPIFKSMKVTGNKAEIYFDNIGNGLTSFRRPLDGFEIAGDDKIFYPAKATLGREGSYVVVECENVKSPVAVRYAFKDYIKGSLYNMFGLPASSFRTDRW